MSYEKDVKWMKTAVDISRLSKCIRAQYGTIILDRRGRHVSSGYNGKPMGSQCDNKCFREGLLPDANAPRCCLHSEQNALVLGNFTEYEGGTLYVTGQPCSDCMLLILQSGISTLVYMTDERDYQGLNEAEKHGISIEIRRVNREDVIFDFERA